MLRLLPEEQKEVVSREYVKRRTIVIFYALILVLGVGVIGLLPSYVLSNARQNEVLERTRIISQSELKGDESELESWLKDMNQKLAILASGKNMDLPSEDLAKTLNQKISGILINNLSWSLENGKVGISISGVSKDRQTLIKFKDEINNSGIFSGATLPISNLAQDKDIEFHLNFTPIRKTL